MFKGRKPSISYFHQFGCTCYILNNKHYLKKSSVKAQRGIFIGYSDRSKAYRVYNSETKMVEESIHVKFDDKEPDNEMSEQNKNFARIQISGIAPEARKDSASDKDSESTEAAQLDVTPETAPEDPEFEDPPEQTTLKLFMMVHKKLLKITQNLYNPKQLSSTKLLIQKLSSLGTRTTL